LEGEKGTESDTILAVQVPQGWIWLWSGMWERRTGDVLNAFSFHWGH